MVVCLFLCVDRVSEGIRTGALWLAIQCGKERLPVFRKSSSVAVSSPTTEYSSGKFPSRSLLSAVSFPLLKGYDTVSQPVTACIQRSWRLVSPRAATMLLMCNTVPSHFYICTRALTLEISFCTQKMRMTKTSV